MNYVVAIPSHKRSEILRDRTLKLLDKLSISHSRIYVFVSKGNIKTYRDILPDDISLILGNTFLIFSTSLIIKLIVGLFINVVLNPTKIVELEQYINNSFSIAVESNLIISLQKSITLTL